MPKIAIYKFLVFFIISYDAFKEPPHLHFSKTKKGKTRLGKIWLNTLEIERTGDLNKQELGKVQRIVKKYQNELLEAFERVKQNKFEKTLILK